MTIFESWSDDQVRSLAGIMDSAAGEGVVDPAIADALYAEAVARNIELIYGLGECPPAQWRRELER